MRRRIIKEPKNVVEVIEVEIKPKLTREEEFLQQAKELGLFKKNKMYKRYEIMISLEKYDKL